jgi:hypothetical protein
MRIPRPCLLDGCDATVALHLKRCVVTFAAGPEGDDQPRHHDWASSGQRGEQGMIGVGGDKLLNLLIQHGNVFAQGLQ